jgi:hypothetical protein
MGSTRSVTVRALVGVAAVLAIAACGSTFSVATPTPAGASVGGGAATPTSAPKTEAVGSTFEDDDGNGDVMNITLSTVINPATSTEGTIFLTAGDYLIGLKFTLVGKTGTSTGDVDFDTVSVIGSDGQTYTPDITDDITGCTNFNDGSYSVTPGQTSVGCAAFQLPKAVKPAQVEWSDLFGGNAPAVWTVS